MGFQKEQESTDLTSLAISTLKEIGVVIEIGEIDRLQRLGKKGNDARKIRPVLLAITTLQKKIQILKIYITHDQPKAVI